MPFQFGYLELLLMLPVMLVGLAVYFLPTILAVARHHPNTLLIFLIDFLLGWTVVGWVIALILVFVESNVAIQGNEPALDIAKQRYARGEINKAEFEDIKKTIQ